MKSAALCIDKPLPRPRNPGLFGAGAKRLVLSRLNRLRHGILVIRDGEERYRFGRCDSVFSRSVTLKVLHPTFYTRVMTRGALGGGESYMGGGWHCDDLPAMVELFLCNRHYLGSLGQGIQWLMKPLALLQHVLRRNTLSGSRRNIGAHYDLGNAFFELFLDDTMMYSCGVFDHPGTTLREASEAKLERICRKLQLKPTDQVLEIGTGWGGFALYAARRYGCRVTSTTISREQHEYARQRVRDAGLDGRITLLLDDYRQLRGSYDKLVSIEMIEAIGHRNFAGYFRKCSALLKPDGMMLLQSITISDQRYAAARNSIDFIQRYIFPGGCLPCVGAVGEAVARNTDMRAYHLEDIGVHYATTLQHWRRRLFANIHEVRRLGYPERFIRMWDYYLAYCEGGFRQRVIGTIQLLLVKPQCRRAPLTGTDYQTTSHPTRETYHDHHDT